MKQLLLVMAPPACGKTYVSKLLCRQLGAVAYFDKDTLAPLVRAGFAAGAQELDMDGAFYATYLRNAEYETLFSLAEEALEFMDLALINAPFGYYLKHPELLYARLASLRNAGVRISVIWMQSTPELCHAHMTERASDRDSKKLEHWESYVAGICFDPPQHLIEQNAIDALYLLDRQIEDPEERELQHLADLIKQGALI